MIELQPGISLRNGNYTLRALIGTGATAHVWSAIQRLPNGSRQEIVLKILLPEITVNPNKRKMFLEEARVAAILQHPNIVRVDAIEQSDGVDFLVMERIWGVELEELIRWAKKNKDVVPWPLAVTLIREAALAIHYANTLTDEQGKPQNLVHRDIKPSNLLLDLHGHIKVIDFGIAKIADSHLQTQMGIIKGTVAYMSPEHLRSEPLDVRSDIYALGVVLYELCTGYRPFTGENMTTMMFSVLTQEPYHPHDFRKDLPQPLCKLLLKTLHKDRDQRSPNAAAFADELAELLHQTNPPTPLNLQHYLDQAFPALRDEYNTLQDELSSPEPSSTQRQQGLPTGHLDSFQPLASSFTNQAPSSAALHTFKDISPPPPPLSSPHSGIEHTFNLPPSSSPLLPNSPHSGIEHTFHSPPSQHALPQPKTKGRRANDEMRGTLAYGMNELPPELLAFNAEQKAISQSQAALLLPTPKLPDEDLSPAPLSHSPKADFSHQTVQDTESPLSFHDLRRLQNQALTTPTTPPPKKRIFLWLALIASLLLGVAGYFLWASYLAIDPETGCRYNHDVEVQITTDPPCLARHNLVIPLGMTPITKRFKCGKHDIQCVHQGRGYHFTFSIDRNTPPRTKQSFKLNIKK